MLSQLINGFIAIALFVGGAFSSLVIQYGPSTDIINLILGSGGAIVLLVLAVWYLHRRDIEKEKRINQLQDRLIAEKENNIAEKDKHIASLQEQIKKQP